MEEIQIYVLSGSVSSDDKKQDRRGNGETSTLWLENWVRKGFEGSQEAKDG